jgi:hypothetical protein
VGLFGAATLGLSLATGVLEAWRGARALAVFGAESWTVPLVALGALRLRGAGVVTSAAALALVVLAHSRRAAGRPVVWPRWPTFLLLPLSAPVASSLMAAAAMATVSLGYELPLEATWPAIGRFVTLGDLALGAGLAGVLGVALAAAVAGLGGPLATGRWGLGTKLVLALGLVQLVIELLNATLGSAAPWADSAAGSLPLF